MKFQTRLWLCCTFFSSLALAHAGVVDDYSTVIARTDEPRLVVSYRDGGQEAYQAESAPVSPPGAGQPPADSTDGG